MIVQKWIKSGLAEDEIKYKTYRAYYKKYLMKLRKIIIAVNLILKVIQ